MNNPDPVAASLEAARANAANPGATTGYVAPVGSVPTQYQPAAQANGGAVTNYQPQGHKLSVSTMKGGGGNSMNVDLFLGVEKGGIVARFANDDPRKMGLGQVPLQPPVLLVDYENDIQLKYSLRVNTPSGIKFYNTYDRVLGEDGVTPWEQMVNKCKQGDASCKGDYPSLNFSGVLLEPLRTVTGVEIIPAGKRIGFSPSMMNWKEYQLFHQQLLQANLIDEYDDNSMEGKVVVQLSHLVKQNKNAIQYGAFVFTCLGDGTDVPVPTSGTVAGAAPPAAPVAINTAAYVPGGQQPAQTVQHAQPPQPIHAAAPAPAAAAETVTHTMPGFMTNAQPGAAATAPVTITQVEGTQAVAAGTIPMAGGATAEAPKRRSRRAAAADGAQ